jgi:dual adaptor for phosphotyrosine/3-phosphotyrosine/3-phosphoinositide
MVKTRDTSNIAYAQILLTCRCANSVKHFQIGWDGHKYTFGMGKFDCLSEFVEHFENKPLIGGDSGLLTQTA